MPHQRLFIALDPSAGTIDALRRVATPLAAQPWPHARWMPRDQWHATVRFLGATPEDGVPYWMRMLESLAGLAAERGPLGIIGAALWPSPARPRVLVVTAKPEDWAQAMASRAEALARDAGYRPETRPFQPHITLARLGGAAASPACVAALETAAHALHGAAMRFDSLSLFASRTPPDGPWFERLATVRLSGG
ncbi:RNA 2',3'-cyclic phosphodiesterase [Ralstonia pseudosolanacearum]|uniref:RNA 2',3'-cyclic phosphodiesterase n=1 Tax=Ralstonia solanacearum species complex TaxID=3116862 RepID=UPI000370CE1F|nr:RNA 2',3'-cyclic phosphodiesterase [Ralstonia pseudosolanacearum]MCK4121690.1 RNA 2',3'-cyclic phosphodiesterase [Ralstonia pseudosolanacearum]